jgi:hypothetical protein
MGEARSAAFTDNVAATVHVATHVIHAANYTAIVADNIKERDWKY